MGEDLWSLFDPHDGRGTFERFARHVPEEWIEEALESTGVATIRRRRIPAERVVWLVVGMALFRDLPIEVVLKHLDVALPSRTGKPPVKSGVSQARKRVGAEAIRLLFERTGKSWATRSADAHRWRGLSLWGVDGTTFRIPDSPENRATFGGRTNQRDASGYPIARMVTLMALRSHVLAGARIAPCDTSELKMATDLWAEIPDNALAIVDRGFFFAEVLIPLAASGNRQWLTRARSKTRYEVVEKLGSGDEIVELNVTWSARQKNPTLPPTWRARAIRYQRKGYRPQVLLTSLLDPKLYPRNEIVSLYHDRWELELGYDEVKTEMLERAETLRSQHPAGVEQEIWGLLLAYNLVRVELEATAREVGVAPTRMSFVAGLRLVRDTLRLAALVSPGNLAKFLERERKDLSRFVLPPRRTERLYPRAVKIKMSHYDRKRATRK
jgi:transposase IS4-like protein/DDE family transposase